MLIVMARAAHARAGVLPMARQSELESRLRAILDPAVVRQRLPRSGPAVVAALGLALLGPLAGLRLAAAQEGGSRSEPPPRADQRPMVEPDLRGDSVAGPLSERLPQSGGRRPQSIEALLAGPDSASARALAGYAGREPTWEGDLVRDRARWALAAGREGRLIEPLIDALRARDWRTRAYAAWALGVAGPTAARDQRAVSELIAQLDHRVWRLRAMAAAALRAIGSSAARGPMERMLRDEAWQVRASAVGYLGEQGDPGALRTLEASLHDSHRAVRDEASRALAGSGGAR